MNNVKKTIKKYNKIEPFNDFWIDCYSTAIFSILQSNHNIDKRYFYNNNYKYEFTKNVRTGMGRVYITMQLEELISKLLINKEIHDFTKDDDIIENLKYFIDKEKVIFLGIDMYYGVPDTSQWHKHHIHHNILVEGYDDEKECVYILETGEQGYKEYEMSYCDISLAAQEFTCFTRDTEIFEINSKEETYMYDNKELKSNALEIVQSIDCILEHISEIWHIHEEKVLSMKDEIEAHLRAIRNRQGVNANLFKVLYGEVKANYYIEEFSFLENEYDKLRNTIVQLCLNNEYFENENSVKEVFGNLLRKEKKIWMDYSKDRNLNSFN